MFVGHVLFWCCLNVVNIVAYVNVTVDLSMNGFSITQFIADHGYPVEAHVNIETEDGYLLDLFRIPHGRSNQNETFRKPVVFLMHGLLGSAENWIVLGPERALAFILADIGYDVWMGNARGTTHSRKHVSYDPNYDSEYWQFSWHEIGVYDLPAQIDYICEETNQTDLFYVGHSQGTTAFFVMTSDKPEYNEKIRLMVALAPVAYMSHIPHVALQALSQFESSINIVSNLIGFNEFVPNNEVLKLAGHALCLERAVVRELCANILFLVGGYDSEQLDRDLIPIITQTSPSGASVKQFLHYGQIIRSDLFINVCHILNGGRILKYLYNMVSNENCDSEGRFQHYDYGVLQNLRIYESSSPPVYELSKISAPVALFYSMNDWLVSPADVKRLASELPNSRKFAVPYKRFNHLDFIFAKDAYSILYLQVIKVMSQYN